MFGRYYSCFILFYVGAIYTSSIVRLRALTIVWLRALTFVRLRALTIVRLRALTIVRLRALTIVRLRALNIVRLRALTIVRLRALTIVRLRALTIVWLRALTIVRLRATLCSKDNRGRTYRSIPFFLIRMFPLWQSFFVRAVCRPFTTVLFTAAWLLTARHILCLRFIILFSVPLKMVVQRNYSVSIFVIAIINSAHLLHLIYL